MQINEKREMERIISLIDHTSLGDDDQPDDIDTLCDEAVTAHGSVAAVCVWPRFAAQAIERLTGTPVRVSSVANFPEGRADWPRIESDTARIVSAGAAEVDVVVPWRDFAAGGSGLVAEAVTRARAAGAPAIKAILETGEIDDIEIIRAAATEALDAGADFLKTSTGKTARSATPQAARALLELLAERGDAAGLKVSGGVRTVSDATGYLRIVDEIMGPEWAVPDRFRFGSSSLLGDVVRRADAAVES